MTAIELTSRTIESPIGPLTLSQTEKGLFRIDFDRGESLSSEQTAGKVRLSPMNTDILSEAVCQLEEYFSGTRKIFDLPLDLRGTPFRMKVWQVLLTIPYGEIRSYGDIARQIGNPKASRAVGQANGANPIPIIIPCHRVTASGGKMGGYSGGLHIKTTLLQLEASRDA